MNAVEDNEFSRMWTTLGAQLPTPRAIVCISAHWETKGTHVTIGNPLETIHDFYGFPNELYRQKYPSPGSPSLAQEVIDNIQSTHVRATINGGWITARGLFLNTPILWQIYCYSDKYRSRQRCAMALQPGQRACFSSQQRRSGNR
jgi:aromatic ring-opening dioxygenase catalytic subunit (LigB family)